MKLYNDETIRFIQENLTKDVNQLLLSAKKYAGTDVAFCADQILSRRQIKDKLPGWYSNFNLWFPARITTEQCSSEQTATYKQRLFGGGTGCDMTGGLGIDTYYISRNFERYIYMERFEEYCEAAIHNFKQLDATNIEVLQGDSMLLINQLPDLDFIYLDPARRSDCNKRLYDLTECEPNIVELAPELLKKSPVVVVKVSPMADINRCIELLPQTKEVHVVSVKNGCKELLLILNREECSEDVKIHCVNFSTDGEQRYSFTTKEERNSGLRVVNIVDRYLYEPNSSVMKGGAFKSVADHYGLKKLHQHSHLYTSDKCVEDFPGRKFEVLKTEDFTKKWLQNSAKEDPKANLATRNFPLSVADIRKRSKIAEGGSLYLFATTLGDDRKVIVYCEKI
ncbi:MAG: THUMP-like domain-containing protein [Bacteroidales bacterium]